jgi:hypothetical protein
VGAAFEHAIGNAPLKTYGHAGQVSEVISGSKVPDYMARIYLDPRARRRFAEAWLDGDPRVRMRTVIEWDEEKVG